MESQRRAERTVAAPIDFERFARLVCYLCAPGPVLVEALQYLYVCISAAHLVARSLPLGDPYGARP